MPELSPRSSGIDIKLFQGISLKSFSYREVGDVEMSKAVT